MSTRTPLRTVETHAEGMPMRIVVDGVAPIPGETMVERLTWARENLKDVCELVVNEPRGHAAMVASILMPAARPDADYGIIYMSGGGFWAMCGHGTIGVATMIVERKMVEVIEPYTKVRLDTAAGLIVVKVRVEGGRAVNATFTNVPSFVIKSDQRINVPGTGSILVDLVYGGNLYSVVDVAQLKRELELDDLDELTDLGLAIVAATREQVPLVHPWTPSMGPLKSMIFTQEGTKDTPAKNLMVKERKYFDRSPCGTGISARMALAHHKGKIGLHEPLACQSVLGTEFTGNLIEATEVEGTPAVIPTITGRAWITGTAEYLLDPSDVFPKGFTF